MIVSCRHWSTVARSRSRFFLTYGVCVLVSMTNIFVGDEVYSGSQTYVYKLRICKKKVGAPINLFCGERVFFLYIRDLHGQMFDNDNIIYRYIPENASFRVQILQDASA